MYKIIIASIIMLFSAFKAHCQTISLDANKVYPHLKESEDYIRFKINNQSFGAKDTVIQIQINTKGFDVCEAIIAKDTLRFLAKFKEGESYEIRQGCCCAAFTLKPKIGAMRGTVTFNNKTKRDLALIVAESNVDTVKINRKKTLFADESAMCMFKPCSILLSETAYFSDKYEYNDNKDYDTLREEQASYIVGSIWFHFLHGEKLVLEYAEKEKSIQLKLMGYLNQSEYKRQFQTSR